MTARTRTPARDAADFGPPLLLNRGQRKVALAPDPDNPNRTVRRAKVRVTYNDWWADGLISHAQREAADRLAVQWEVVQGGSHGDGEPVQGGCARSHPPLRMLQAAEDLRMAQAAADPWEWTWLVEVAVYNIEYQADEAPSVAAALQKLVVLWGME